MCRFSGVHVLVIEGVDIRKQTRMGPCWVAATCAQYGIRPSQTASEPCTVKMQEISDVGTACVSAGDGACWSQMVNSKGVTAIEIETVASMAEV